MLFDVARNRRAQKWSNSEQLGRALWALVWPLFRFSPRPLWRWRAFLLRVFGAQIDDDVHVHPTVLIEIPWNLRIGRYGCVGDRAILYNLGLLTIGSGTTISQGAHLCGGTHDYRKSDFPLIKTCITIGENVWICADAFVGPGVEIGDRAILGARAVVIRKVASDSIVAGNPARLIKMRGKVDPFCCSEGVAAPRALPGGHV
jgi:putative colanic acid biosynthesis acetyltransferase WcaF